MQYLQVKRPLRKEKRSEKKGQEEGQEVRYTQENIGEKQRVKKNE